MGTSVPAPPPAALDPRLRARDGRFYAGGMVTNAAIALDLAELADLLELQDANPFKVRAWRNAARTVADHPTSCATLVAEGGDLTALPGIGKDIAAQIARRVGGHEIEPLLAARAAVPAGLLDVVRVPGVGPKKARALWTALRVDGLEALAAAARDGRIEHLKGFGATMQSKILAGVEAVRRMSGRMRRADAEVILTSLTAWMQGSPAVARIEVAGSFRRGRDTVGDLDLLVVTDEPNAVMKRFEAAPDVRSVLASGLDKTSVLVTSDLQVDLRVVEEHQFGAAWIYFTGSKDHNVRLRRRAQDRGAKLNEYGLFDATGVGRRAGAHEHDVYEALGLQWIPPELREDRGEVEASERDALPRLITVGDVVADLHVHTDWSDGRGTLLEMMQAAAAQGLTTLAVTDHGPTLKMTGGLTRERALRQWDAIDEASARVPGLTVLKGIEVDILADGTLDMDDDVLAGMDLVVASVHARFDMPAAAQTERIVKALAHRSVNILGHPTGRLIGRREGIDVDMDAVVAAAKEHDVALEINAHPSRLDVDDVTARRAILAGVPLAIDSDAHSVQGLSVMRHGVMQARRGWVTACDVVNTWPIARLRSFLAKDPIWRTVDGSGG